MTMLKLIGDWLDGSGWTYVMTSASVVTLAHTHPEDKGLIK